MAKTKKTDVALGTVTVFTIEDPGSTDSYADMVFTHAPMTREQVFKVICKVAGKADRDRPDEWSMDVSDIEDAAWIAAGLTPHATPHPWIKVEGDTEIDENADVKP